MILSLQKHIKKSTYIINILCYNLSIYLERVLNLDKIKELFNTQKINQIQNLESYKNNGYIFNYSNNENNLSIFYNDIHYEVKIIKIENNYFWHLSPYNNSCFVTNLNNPNSFDMVLFAIKENDTLYQNK